MGRTGTRERGETVVGCKVDRQQTKVEWLLKERQFCAGGVS